jgi:predicted  nucleic acid-binding Zn-ribbon protein
MTTDLKNQLELLKSLQDVYIVLHDLDHQLVEIPSKIEAAKADYKSTSELIDARRAQKDAIDKKRKNDETELSDLVARIKEREAKLYAIKTNKEYQAAIKEIADAKQANRDREDALLGLMEQINGLDEEITQLSEGLADKEKAFGEKEAELKKREAELKSERDKQYASIADAENRIDKKIIRQYRFIQTKISDALALAVEGVCLGCNKRIPPQLYIEIQKWSELISCPNCHRILFFSEAPASDGGQK